ncbi:uncharacterized protein LOC110662986 isoform X2 [Hevea brasiliensis]|uniref:uncharacterized protein LOC110662986 isoform X2 n=1 Tax=Hevea brasiliensis TaxID=3981 RepID=UPI000B770529|nr:uncharacterized protein LOC110662986 isoform X2 [Hevea brasiliensis]
MACWSAENATKAYLRALKMGKRSKEPDMAEFISALAAGNNAQLMVVASARVAGSTTLPLVAAAQQTGGQGSWPNEFKTHFLPIGEGLLVTRIGGKVDDGSGQRKRSRWVIRVDECTGEEHVYRVTCPQQEIEA